MGIAFDDNNDTTIQGGTDGSTIGNTGDKLRVDGSGVTQPVSAVSLPLPTGAATSASQTTGNNSLSSIDTKTPPLGQTTMSASSPVTIASNQTALPVTDNGGSLTVDGTVNAAQSGTWTVGVNNAGGASAVNIQDGGNSITIDALSLPLPTGAATSALQTTGNSSLSSIDNKLTTTNSSLAAIDAGIPAALGQTTMSASMPVVFASDQTALTVTGSITTSPGPITSATYSASATNFVPAASATDVFTITGSATKTVKIIDFGFSSTTTAGSGIALGISFIKRSTADSGGTSVVATNIPHDSNNAAATAVVRHYTANPTLGTAVGTIRSRRIIVPAAGSNGSGTVGGSEEEFSVRPGQPIILRGVTQQFCINLNGTSITGPVSAAFVEWVEE